MYEVRSHVKEQLKFLESIDRHSAQRKQEQEREKLLKAAKVSWHSLHCCQCCLVWPLESVLCMCVYIYLCTHTYTHIETCIELGLSVVCCSFRAATRTTLR